MFDAHEVSRTRCVRSCIVAAALSTSGCDEPSTSEPEPELDPERAARVDACREHIKVEDFTALLQRRAVRVTVNESCGGTILVAARMGHPERGAFDEEARLVTGEHVDLPRTDDGSRVESIRTQLVYPSLQSVVVPIPAPARYVKHAICLAGPDNTTNAIATAAVPSSMIRWDTAAAQWVALAANDEPLPLGDVILLEHEPGQERRLLHVGELAPLPSRALLPGDNLVATPLDMGCTSPSELLARLGPGHRIGTWDAVTGVTSWYPSCPPSPNASGAIVECGDPELAEHPLPGCTAIHVYVDPDAPPTTWPPAYEPVERWACDEAGG